MNPWYGPYFIFFSVMPSCQLTVTSTPQPPFFASVLQTSSLCCLYSGFVYNSAPPKNLQPGMVPNGMPVHNRASLMARLQGRFLEHGLFLPGGRSLGDYDGAG